MFHGIFEAFKELLKSFKEGFDSAETLSIYSLCWFVAVFIFFSISATKLPSYWLPATQLQQFLSNSFLKFKNQNKNFSYLYTFNILILFGLSIAFFFSSFWLGLINDPEMPNLAIDLKSQE